MSRLPWWLAIAGCGISLAACMLASMRHSAWSFLFAAGFLFCFGVMWATDPRRRPKPRGVRELSQLDRVLSDALWEDFNDPQPRKEVWWDG